METSSSATTAVASCQVHRDAWSVVYDCWAPHEMYHLGGFAAPTAVPPPSHSPLTVPTAAIQKLTFSAIRSMDFSALHFALSPARRMEQVIDRRQILSRATGARISFSQMGPSLDGSSSPSRASVMLSRVTDALVGPSSNPRRISSFSFTPAERRFRVLTYIAGRCIAVKRADSHVHALLHCLRRTFPQFIVPSAESPSDVRSLHLEQIVDCIHTHSKELCGYFPVLFFLFEGNTNHLDVYFNRTLEHSRAIDAFHGEPLRMAVAPPQERSSFLTLLLNPFSSSLSQPATSTQLTDVEVIGSSPPGLFPQSFLGQYSVAMHMAMCCRGIEQAARSLDAALGEENAALMEFADCLLSGEIELRPPSVAGNDSSGGCSDHMATVAGSSTTVDDGNSGASMTTVVDIGVFLAEAANQQRQGPLQLMGSLVMSAEVGAFMATSLKHFFSQPVSWAREVCSLEGLVDRSSSTSQQVLTAARSLLEIRRRSLRLFGEHMEVEATQHSVKLHHTLRSILYFLSAFTKHFAESFEVDPHQQQQQVTANSPLNGGGDHHRPSSQLQCEEARLGGCCEEVLPSGGGEQQR